MTQQQETRRQNTEQERGGQAWKNVKAIQQKDKTLQKEYRSLARGINAMIQINGLGQPLGFPKAKGKGGTNKAHFLLLQHLSECMRNPNHWHSGSRYRASSR